jgi:hypothetical protein
VDEVSRPLSKLDPKLTKSTWHPVYPGLYLDLRKKTEEALSAKIAGALSAPDRDTIRSKIRILKVETQPSLKNVTCVAADSSSNMLPLAISRIALIGAIAVRHPGNVPPSVSGGVVDLPANYSDTDFLVHLSAKREALIPEAILHQFSTYGKSKFALCDGPLSISQWYNLASSQEVKDSVNKLILSRNRLIEGAKSRDSGLFGVVKRSVSQYFQAKLGWTTKFSDQFLLHQALEYGERTEDVSVTKVLKESMAEVSGQPLTGLLSEEIHAFYVKTTRSILAPPLRIEVPAYATSRIDEIASYALTTAIESYDLKYDGLPQAQCLAHRDGKVTGDAMSAILREQLSKFAKNTRELKLLSLYSTAGER